MSTVLLILPNTLPTISTSQMMKQMSWRVNVLYDEANRVAEKPTMKREPKPRIFSTMSSIQSLRFVLYSESTDRIIRMKIATATISEAGFSLTDTSSGSPTV